MADDAKTKAEMDAEVKRMSEYDMKPWVTRLSQKLRGANIARKDRNSQEVTLDDIDKLEKGQAGS